MARRMPERRVVGTRALDERALPNLIRGVHSVGVGSPSGAYQDPPTRVAEPEAGMTRQVATGRPERRTQHPSHFDDPMPAPEPLRRSGTRSPVCAQHVPNWPRLGLWVSTSAVLSDPRFLGLFPGIPVRLELLHEWASELACRDESQAQRTPETVGDAPTTELHHRHGLMSPGRGSRMGAAWVRGARIVPAGIAPGMPGWCKFG